MLRTIQASTRISRGIGRHCVPCYSLLFCVAPGAGVNKGGWGEGNAARLFSSQPGHQQQAIAAVESSDLVASIESHVSARQLPPLCPGCGALSQTVDADSAGFYGSRRAERALKGSKAEQDEDRIFQQALQSGALSVDPAETSTSTADNATPTIPICDRCHYLLHQSRGTSIIHPSMLSIRQMIEESPHTHNHIYHVVDAADFPMSLIPNLTRALDLPRLRTQNRRSKQTRFTHGRVAEISFVITRADLLAPQKEQVDRMLPVLKEILRDALGRSGRNVRLGNVRCVSAQRGWWTPMVKEEIWGRGGAAWMVGKANVGKSALFEVVFPKGRNQKDVNVKKMRAEAAGMLRKDTNDGIKQLEGIERGMDTRPEAHEDSPTDLSDRLEADGLVESEGNITPSSNAFADSPAELSERPDIDEMDRDIPETSPAVLYQPQNTASITEDVTHKSELEVDSETDVLEEEDHEELDSSFNTLELLPPAQDETAYPHMPLVSSLPGTTASPIRIPFGNGKGELIDLPGIHRSDLADSVLPEHRKTLVMQNRPKPEQHSIKPRQSLLLGGLIRITPKHPEDQVFLAYPYVTLEPHVTSTSKAVALQTGIDEEGEAYSGTVPSISTPEAKKAVRSAGTFALEWDVTKSRAGPLTHKAAGKMKAANLPFVVYSADLLIEGVGWVELVCQVRNRPRGSRHLGEDVFAVDGGSSRRPSPPTVEVFTPTGEFVGVRRPIGAWVVAGEGGKMAKHKVKGRPRMSIGFQRRREGGARGGAGDGES